MSSIDVAMKGIVGFMVGYMGRKLRDPAASVYFKLKKIRAGRLLLPEPADVY